MSEEERQAIIHLLDKQARYEYCIKNNISFSDEDYEAYIIRQSMINKDKEIEKLKELCNKYEEEHKTTFEEWKKTINIINELEKWLEVNLTNLEKEKANNTYDKGLKQGMLSNGRLIKNKLQELKGDGSND